MQTGERMSGHRVQYWNDQGKGQPSKPLLKWDVENYHRGRQVFLKKCVYLKGMSKGGQKGSIGTTALMSSLGSCVRSLRSWRMITVESRYLAAICNRRGVETPALLQNLSEDLQDIMQWEHYYSNWIWDDFSSFSRNGVEVGRGKRGIFSFQNGHPLPFPLQACSSEITRLCNSKTADIHFTRKASKGTVHYQVCFWKGFSPSRPRNPVPWLLIVAQEKGRWRHLLLPRKMDDGFVSKTFLGLSNSRR